VNRVSRGPPIVVAIRVYRCPVSVHPPVGVQGEGQKRGRSVTAGEHPPHRALIDRAVGQIWCVLAALGRPLHRLGREVQRGQPAAYPRHAEFGDGIGVCSHACSSALALLSA
jgi:hypothetical protein